MGFLDRHQPMPQDGELDGELIGQYEEASSYESVRYWNLQIASCFPDCGLFFPVVNLLKEEDVDMKMAAIIVLAQMAFHDIYGGGL